LEKKEKEKGERGREFALPREMKKSDKMLKEES